MRLQLNNRHRKGGAQRISTTKDPGRGSSTNQRIQYYDANFIALTWFLEKSARRISIVLQTNPVKTIRAVIV